MMKSNENQAIYLYEYKRDLKASEIVRNMNEGFGPNTTNEHIAQGWFKRFRNEKDRFD